MAFRSCGHKKIDCQRCCVPVSVAGLINGAIVTVGKDPTRVKLYRKTGACIIEGISEMVKGCNYIPMIADSKDNLYQASLGKGMLKYVAI